MNMLSIGNVGLIDSIEMDCFLSVTSAKKSEETVFEPFRVLVNEVLGILTNDLQASNMRL